MGLGYFNSFSIRLLEKSPGDEFFSTRGKPLAEFKAQTRFRGKNPVCILADPFLLKSDGEWLLFYESQTRRYGKGELHMRRSPDGINWSGEKVVLREDFHLSFPNVFKDGGRTYMIPETGADGSIRLYEAVDDTLGRWTLVRKIISDGRPWADSDIVCRDGKYYLLTCVHSRKAPEARLFVADSLEGEFREHPCSPFSTDPACARNAGRLFEHEGRLYRPVQDCSHGYGKQISIMEVTALTPTEYSERLAFEHILDSADPFYKRGGHQFCPVEVTAGDAAGCGRALVATDAKVRNYNFRENLAGYVRHIFGK